MKNPEPPSTAVVLWESPAPDLPPVGSGGVEPTDLVVTVAVNQYLVTVHHAQCPYYLRSFLRLAVTPGMTVRLCRYCRPPAEQALALLPGLEMYKGAHGLGRRLGAEVKKALEA